ncbi:hypothetical protein LAZ40_11680 [Cereibacter sphaeroides]|uniref:hypothetical protein n=1 Tax=Cereibacter sphaeroides TaxID=1063 RepID=UPI001F2D3C97|nr:hypothetical protein [Cereibacter sphaeroides]MCE6959679.1 hypothetical protein [Cereibacter sphaeroides]MCE6974460.1 hypothetical protein [Cereibacter sphaeroides]
MDAYHKPVNRLIAQVEARAGLLQRQPVLTDLADQISLRSRVMKEATVNLETAALRAVIRSVKADADGPCWPAGVVPVDWMKQVSAADLEALESRMNQPNRALFAASSGILAENIARAESLGTQMTREELAHLLAGRSVHGEVKPKQKEQRHLTWRDLLIFEFELSDHDPISSIEALASRSARTPLEGLLRIFIHAIWISGMRPTEVWTCRLMVPRMDLAWTDDMRDLLRRNPTQALLDNLLVPVERLAAQTGEGLVRSAHLANDKAGAPSILMIQAAKQTNANPNIRAPIRLQVLEAIPLRHLGMLAYAAQLRHLKLEWKVQDQFRSSMTKTLKRIAKREEELRDLNVNLYSFRHSFATRVKRALPPHEAAALTGHTAIDSLYGYGEFRASKAGRTGHRAQDWIPAPDPTQAERIRLQWATAGREARPAAAASAPGA